MALRRRGRRRAESFLDRWTAPAGRDVTDRRLSVSREAESTVVHVDGRLAVHGVRDLEGTVGGTSDPVILDLTNLLSAADAGVAALRLLIGRRVQLRGTSPYVSLLLRVDLPQGR